MADNYSEMSIAFPVTEAQAEWLGAAWAAMESIDGSGASDHPLPDGLTLGDEIYYPPCALQIEREEGEVKAWMYTEESVDAEGLATVLQQFLKHFDLEMGIGIEAALTCSKPRIGQFGGFAIWVTKDNVEAWSTGGWLAEREKVHARDRVIASIGMEKGPVTCDGCSATSESGWGNTPLCVDCQLKTDPSLVCEFHMQTHNRNEPCPACEALLSDPLEEPGALVHKLNAYTFLGRRAECAVTAPHLSAARDWEGVTCPACLRAKPEVQRETIEEALENDRCGICGSVDHFREDCPKELDARIDQLHGPGAAAAVDAAIADGSIFGESSRDE